jgi:hypothetical protein
MRPSKEQSPARKSRKSEQERVLAAESCEVGSCGRHYFARLKKCPHGQDRNGTISRDIAIILPGSPSFLEWDFAFLWLDVALGPDA